MELGAPHVMGSALANECLPNTASDAEEGDAWQFFKALGLSPFSQESDHLVPVGIVPRKFRWNAWNWPKGPTSYAKSTSRVLLSPSGPSRSWAMAIWTDTPKRPLGVLPNDIEFGSTVVDRMMYICSSYL